MKQNIDLRAAYKLSTTDILQHFGVEKDEGLSAKRATQQLEKFGKNELQMGKRINPLALFISQFKDVLIVILLIAALVSFGLSFVGEQRTLTGQEKTAHFQEKCTAEIERSGALKNEYCQYAQNPATAEDPVVTERESPKEALLIFVIVLAIAVIGFLNEYRAEKTVEALKKLVSQKTQVRRNGDIVEIDASEIVPGDIIVLSEGQKIPADTRIIEVKSLRVNEASLTGESLPVNKNALTLKKDAPLGDQHNMLFAGTFVTTGTAEGVVTATGQGTELGKIASLVSSVETEQTPMQRKLDDLGRKLGYFILAICVFVFIIVFLFVEEAVDKDFIQRMLFAFTAAVALAVAAIPEGLAFVVRISLALGARRMAAKKALVRKLSAVEALGSTDVICTDKTGTLTRGQMTVREIVTIGEAYELTGRGYDTVGELQHSGKRVTAPKVVQSLLLIGVLCNNARLGGENGIIGDPTEAALLVSAAKLSMDRAALQADYHRVDEVPFSSERKRMSTVHEHPDGGYFVASKGGVEAVLAVCAKKLSTNGKVTTLTDQDRHHIAEQAQASASRALRVLALAYKQTDSKPAGNAIESDLIFVGLQCMMDPPRQEVVEVVHRVQAEAGMKVVMITGDHIETARAVAAEIGIEGESLSGQDLDAMTQDEFVRRVETIGVYARVNPEHKIRIVQALKANGHQVAMTGDGVNDAPAIKAADIGIAMGITGTDAAKEASDLILLDDQFLTIINAIEEGRGIFDNVRKFVNFLISCNIAEVLVILAGILLFNNLILTAAQLLFINIVTDGLPAIALGSDPAQRDVLRSHPKRFQQAILSRRVWLEIVAFGVLMTIVLVAQYWYNHTREGAVAAVSAAFASMVVFELVRLIDIRTDYKIKWFSNPWLSVALLGSFVLQFVVLYVPFVASYFEVGPLSNHDWVIMFAGSVFLFVSMKLLNPLFSRFGPEH